MAYVFLLASILLAATRPVSGEVYLDGEEIVFVYRGPEGQSVYLVGDFNGWNPTVDRMMYQDGAYRITLFLLPGRHKYLYFVDGEPVRDRDNPCVDQEGNSCFNFFEIDGDYELYFTESPGEVFEPVDLEHEASAVLIGYAGEDSLGGGFKAGFQGTFRKRLSLDFSTGYLRSDKDESDLEPALLRVEGVGEFEKWNVRAFSRSPGLEMDDPLSLMTRVGPYDYPLGLFCRGVEASVELAEGVRARAFYANRLEGYPGGTGVIEAGLEGVDSTSGLERVSGDPVDMDMFGVVAAAGLAGFRVNYLFRNNRSFSEWTLEDSGDHPLISGPEETDIHGLWFSYPLAESFTVELEYLRGFNKLNEANTTNTNIDSTYDYKQLDISSWKGYASLQRAGEKNKIRIFYSYEKEEEIQDREFYEEPGHRHQFGLSAMAEISGYRLSFRAVDSEFRGAGPAQFWFQRNNLWLDGDRITPSRLIFLDSGGIFESNIGIGDWKEGRSSIPSAGNTSLTLGLICQSDDISRRVVEIRGVKSLLFDSLMKRFSSIDFEFLKNLDLLADIRCVFYNHDEWKGKKNFADTFLGLRKSFGNSSWVMAGVGARPYVFDKWYFGIIPSGRTRFIEESGVLEYSSYQDYSDLYELLSEAERKLSADWSVSVEGCLKF